MLSAYATEFLSRVDQVHIDSELQVGNVLERIRVKSMCNAVWREECEFAASHFHELLAEPQKLKDLPFESLSEILENSLLKLHDEDELCYFVMNAARTNSQFFSLFKALQFEYLSSEVTSNLCELFEENFDYMDVRIWQRLKKRLVNGGLATGNPERHTSVRRKNFPYARDSLSGIIAHLTEECGGNVYDKGVVGITGGPIYNDELYGLKHVATLTKPEGDRPHFNSHHSEEEQTICYDFKGMRIRPTAYTLRSYYNKANVAHLKSWVIEVSNDMIDWTIIDKKEPNDDLNGPFYIKGYEIQTSVPLCRYIRLRRVGNTHWSSCNTCFCLTGFEVFGELYSNDSVQGSS